MQLLLPLKFWQRSTSSPLLNPEIIIIYQNHSSHLPDGKQHFDRSVSVIFRSVLFHMEHNGTDQIQGEQCSMNISRNSKRRKVQRHSSRICVIFRTVIHTLSRPKLNKKTAAVNINCWYFNECIDLIKSRWKCETTKKWRDVFSLRFWQSNT